MRLRTTKRFTDVCEKKKIILIFPVFLLRHYDITGSKFTIGVGPYTYMNTLCLLKILHR